MEILTDVFKGFDTIRPGRFKFTDIVQLFDFLPDFPVSDDEVYGLLFQFVFIGGRLPREIFPV